MAEININVSTKTIFKLLGIALALYIFYIVADLVLLLFVSIILAALIDPFADWFQKKKVPRAFAVLLIYAILFSLLAAAMMLLAPVIAHDLPQAMENIGKFWVNLQQNEVWHKITIGVQSAQSTLANYGLAGKQTAGASGAGVQNTLSGVFSTISGFFGSVFSMALVLVITFYMVVQDDPLKKMLRYLVPDKYIPWCCQLMQKMRNKLGSWLRGQLVLSAIVGFLVFIGLSIFGVKYAALLALLAALFEFVPYVGPVLASIPALFLAFVQSGVVSFFVVLVMYIIIQQLENHLIVPKVMQKAVGLNPVISIVAILTGAKLAGVLGALVAIPVATALSVFLQDVLEKKENN